MSIAIHPLLGAVRGTVIEPGHPDHEDARLVMNRACDLDFHLNQNVPPA